MATQQKKILLNQYFNQIRTPEYLHVLRLPKPDPGMCRQPVEEIRHAQKNTSKPATNSKAGKPSESHV